VTGSVEFLAGMDEGIVRHARVLLRRARVGMVEHLNVQAITETSLTLQDGRSLPFDVVVWAGGVQAPPVVRALPVAHGHSGRLRVDGFLEVIDRPGVFGVGDVAEFVDATTGIAAPATAQAALAEAPIAAANLVARALGRPMRPFVYRERGVVVAVGLGRGAGRAAGITIWGRPAAALKKAVEKGYAFATESGTTPRGL